jgi:hypothetical protein
MATTRVEGEFSLVYLVWNSIANLRTQSEQVSVAMEKSPLVAR